MNYEEAKIKAKENYEQRLKDIELCNEVTKKIEPFLPKGWVCNIEKVCFNLEIQKGDWDSKEKTDAIEFKTVCKMAEKIIGKKLERNARVNKEDEKIWLLSAERYFQKHGGHIGIEIRLYYPKNMPDCKITWKTKTSKVAQVSDECLGLT